MKKIPYFSPLGCFLFLYLIPVYSTQETLNNWPCTYLDPEIVYRINEKEIKKIVEIGSRNGLNAIQLSCYYKCLTFLFENNIEYLSVINENIAFYSQVVLVPLQPDTIQLGNWMNEANIASIDLLCINLTNKCLYFLQNAEKCLNKIKYILINNEPSLHKAKEYLKKRGFRAYFDGVSLFKHVLFINERTKSLKIDAKFVQDFNTPVPSPLLQGNASSELIYAALENNHQPFHDLEMNKVLDINYQDSNGNTALMIAAANDSQYPLKKLLQHRNLDLTLRNKNGCTALIIAAGIGRSSIVQFILDDPYQRAIAIVDMVNNLGMSAEETARLIRATEIADLINVKKTENVQNISNEFARGAIPEKVLICGICKDVAEYLPDEIRIFEKIGTLFEDYRIIIYENNSTDGTQNILREWVNKNSKVTAQFEFLTKSELENQIINKSDNGELNRIELIARARNKLLDKIMSHEYNSYPYIIMMDMDFLSDPNTEGIIEVFQSKREWDAVFGYGVGKTKAYWDWYAFRDFNQPFGPELLGHDWFSQKMWSLSKTDQWCPVYSAFGGIGIYKRASIKECRYSGCVTKDLEEVYKNIINSQKISSHPIIEKYLYDSQQLSKQITIFSTGPNLSSITDQSVGIVLQNDTDALIWRMNSFAYQYPIVCEHVPFHASMILKGHEKLFINPRLVLIYER